jgi:LAO/AO transport system kinase
LDSINPNFKKFKPRQTPTAVELLAKLKQGDRAALSQALTLVESKNTEHREVAEELIHKALPLTGKSIRIGITGVPGVGKSTFIEAFGQHLTSLNKKVAVLAIDPSSTKNRGSILGDKTRMNELSLNQNAFIRPSPSAGSLGGVARKTRESILLCEASGYDVIIIETVGVGQSETAVKSMVDFFMLLMLAGAGDELQGIKRGIMEMADLLVINKADGDNLNQAKRASGEYKRALHLFPPNPNEWIPKVCTASALQQIGMNEIWEVVGEFENHQKTKGHFKDTRKEQALKWFEESIGELLMESFRESETLRSRLAEAKIKVKKQQIEPHTAAKQLIRFFLNH